MYVDGLWSQAILILEATSLMLNDIQRDVCDLSVFFGKIDVYIVKTYLFVWKCIKEREYCEDKTQMFD